MSETKFTKGEWNVQFGTMVFSSSAIEHEQICDTDNKFDAHLIASAPEMYEMLDEVLNVLGHELNPTNKSYIKAIKELLAKARGEEC